MPRTEQPALVPIPSTPARGFYRQVLRALVRHNVPCLVAGTYALECYTGIRRKTRDLDLFITRGQWDAAVDALASEGIPSELSFPHWLGKAGSPRLFVDLVWASANGLCRVTEDWFPPAPVARLHGINVRMCPPEELIWSKAFVMERERFDGADVVHLIRARGASLDWDRLLARFGEHWEVLLAHLVLFGFVFPAERDAVPSALRQRLLARAGRAGMPPQVGPLCRGTLLSREQYLVDVEERGDADARLLPPSLLDPADLAIWTEAIPAARRATLHPKHRPRGVDDEETSRAQASAGEALSPGSGRRNG